MRHERFGALILTHGRPDRVYTYPALRRCGYTGPVVVVVDNEDPTVQQYEAAFPGNVYVFDKEAMARAIDEGDNFRDRRAIIYARNASFQVAKLAGFDHFIQLDDDYTGFWHMRNDKHERCEKHVRDLDAVFDAMLDYYKTIPALSIAMSQSGDFIAGAAGTAWRKPRRKAMNSFICSVDRPFTFFGRINEDVNTYTNLGSRGGLFLTTTHVSLKQKRTQQNAGGMTELYRACGTYVKSFYTVLYQPSSVKVSALQGESGSIPRIHHKVRWRYTVPVIIREQHRKGAA